jgi:hypothetical protein
VDLVEDVIRLWAEPVGPAGEAARRFAAEYADPVVANGTPLTPARLTDRARLPDELGPLSQLGVADRDRPGVSDVRVRPAAAADWQSAAATDRLVLPGSARWH